MTRLCFASLVACGIFLISYYIRMKTLDILVPNLNLLEMSSKSTSLLDVTDGYWCEFLQNVTVPYLDAIELIPLNRSIPRLKAQFSENIHYFESFPMYVYNSLAYPKDSFITPNLRSTGIFDGSILEAILQKLVPGQTFLDIGANIGSIAFHVANLGFHVVGFEPMARNGLAFTMTQCANPRMNISLIRKALSDHEGHCQVQVDPINTGNYQVQCHLATFNKESSVIVTRLDSILHFPELDNVGVIKIDTQGSEMAVLRGGTRYFLTRRVPYVICEFWPPVLRQRGDDPVRLLESWNQIGYQVRIGSWSAVPLERSNFSSFVETLFLRPPHFTDLYLTWQA